MPKEEAERTSQAVSAVKGDLFDTARPGGLHERVYKSLVHAIISGRFAEGDKLPSEAELAMIFTVSRPVVRQALEKLRAEGVIESLRGSGNYVTGLDRLVDSMQEFGVDWSKHAKTMLDDLEFRLVIEPEAAYLAARRRTQVDLNRMRAALGRFEQAHATGRITHHFDYLFHEAIALATTNTRFIDAARSVEFSKDVRSLLIRHLVYFHPVGRGAESIQEHLRVFELIEDREPESARKAMWNHLNASRNRLNEQLQVLRNGLRGSAI
ncbi:FadR/GntR family transcriptional regulator [Pseudaminobacter salicylatoxidans]|uniref:FadR/GntR family transcriptional regulator n=1 Tax=Pseudaminobacter salicylatoxidans TaxID=93369 RepID=UPI0002F27AED|nr:FadR/GntR family transcriptional regulator [Pseudaminobacter salicylatoxidans]